MSPAVYGVANQNQLFHHYNNINNNNFNNNINNNSGVRRSAPQTIHSANSRLLNCSQVSFFFVLNLGRKVFGQILVTEILARFHPKFTNKNIFHIL
jgi:hypothetical protein